MVKAIELVAEAMAAVSNGNAKLPLRTAMDIDGVNKLGIMPGVLGEVYGVKLISLFPGNPAKGLSSHIGAMVLFDPETGAPSAMVDADALTAIRTAAASAVATRALAREDAETLAIIGTGEQALSHIEAICAVRGICTVRVAGRSLERAESFVLRAQSAFPALRFIAGENAEAAVEAADIICTVTSSSTPVLEGAWVGVGAHINAVGASVPSMQEIDEAVLQKARVFTDYRPSALAQAREIMVAIAAGRMEETDILAEIGEVLARGVQGRTGADDITLYRSLGIAAQDLICADFVRQQMQ
jgi:ornithine cyclodeaminase